MSISNKMTATPSREQSAVPLTRKRSRIQSQVACSNCIKSKRACDGQRPVCGRCASRKPKSCHYDTEDHSQSRMQSLKQMNKDLQARLEGVAQALKALSELPRTGQQQLLATVCDAEDPLNELIAVGTRVEAQRVEVNRQVSLLQSSKAKFPSLDSPMEYELNMRYRSMYPVLSTAEVMLGQSAPKISKVSGSSSPALSSEEAMLPSELKPFLAKLQVPLCDPRLAQVNSNHWSSLTIDHSLATLALNLYFLTDHPVRGFFDMDLFLQAVVDQDTRSFCSRFLVSAILAFSFFKIASFHKSIASLATSLRAEAETYLDHLDKPTPADMAAMNVMYSLILHSGAVEKSEALLDTILARSRELPLFADDSAAPHTMSQPPSDEQHFAAVVAWSIFGSLYNRWTRWNKKPEVAFPCVPQPNIIRTLRTSTAFTRTTQEVFICISDCWVVLYAYIEASLNAADHVASFNAAVNAMKGLLRIADSHSDIFHDTSDVVCVPIARLWYHMTIVSLFRPFVDVEASIPGFFASNSTARAIYVASAVQLEHIALQYLNNPLSTTTPAWVASAVTVAALTPRIHSSTIAKTCFRRNMAPLLELANAFPAFKDLIIDVVQLGLRSALLSADAAREVLAESFPQWQAFQTRGPPDSTAELLDILQSIARDSNGGLHGFRRYLQ